MRKLLFSSLLFLAAGSVRAQYNTDRLIRVGQSALYYEDYVLSIQYFSRAIAAKPYLYEPWFGRGEAKFRLDDFVGAEADCTEAIKPLYAKYLAPRGENAPSKGIYTDRAPTAPTAPIDGLSLTDTEVLEKATGEYHKRASWLVDVRRK